MDTITDGLPFKQWLARVELIVTTAIGVGLDDVGDWPSYDTYQSEATPAEGVEEWAEYHSDEIPEEVMELLFQ